MRTLLSWAAFAAAVYAFSGLWAAFRSAFQGRPATPPGAFLGLVVLFVLSLGYLAFVIYAADRGAGRVRRRIAFFDRILDRGQHG
jgi:hypothetical protein